MSLRQWTGFYFRMPIKFKLTLGSTLLILALLLGYNILQYMIMEHWIIHREKKSIEQNMDAILNDLLEQETTFKPANLAGIKLYLNKMNRDDQRIRILGDDNRPIITISNNVPVHVSNGIDKLESNLSISQQTFDIYKQDGYSLLIMKSPLTIHEFTGTVEIVKSLEQFEELSKTISQVMFYFALGAVTLSILVGWLLTRNLLRPLQGMAQTIRDVKSKGIQERMRPALNGDEISTLMLMFNEMMDQVEDAFRHQTRFVEDASHELRTPIAIIEGHLAMLSRWGKKDPVILSESLEASLEEFARLKRLVTELLALSRAEKDAPLIEMALTNLPAAIESIVDRFAVIQPEFNLETDVLRVDGVRIGVPVDHLEQIMFIVLDNAAKYALQDKTIVVMADVYDQQLHIEVTDRGIGIPDKDIPYVTERFYRVDKARSRDQGGNGLGLAIAKRQVERYKGSIAIRSKERMGTTVTISFPCLSPPS
ncbi:HAMP domain-containing sensor histidine kinase [Paenibacillus sp. YIM B09110]|uniref:HAMP domain-containing sensor histidine kinase n=1 Tax=Paenibacillus sp. YIM B09110 TaxID=3126102 RepID=UPI00301C5C48